VKARFISPMLLQRAEMLSSDRHSWSYELKYDGYRAIAFKTAGAVSLRSRNDHDFRSRYPDVVRGLANLPPDTVVDGEIVALDAEGRPSFTLLQDNPAAPRCYFVFDVIVLRGRDLSGAPLSERKKRLEERVLPALAEPVRYAAPFAADLSDLIHAVKGAGLEGLVAKRIDSGYEPGLRTGAWQKMRVYRGQEFVIGGYTVGAANFDALIVGYYENGALRYAARTRNGFTADTRAQIARRFSALETATCPFVNLPETRSGRWGEGLTAAKMRTCRWLEPVLVAQIEFVEWTPESHLRHARFIGLRDDRPASGIVRER
jgi:DNA ligase D-like protein (predicted ligase)